MYFETLKDDEKYSLQKSQISLKENTTGTK